MIDGNMANTSQPRRLLAVLAHPDDECFGTGGALALYAAQGVSVSLICATRGEVGEISDPALATPETLGQVREQELRESCRVLGINEPVLLDYRDSGMAGTADNNHPASLNQASPDEVIGKLSQLMGQLKPQVVVTFEPNGGYGHPDHIAIYRHAVAAFQSLDKGLGYPKLYYVAIPRSRIKMMVAHAPPDSPFHQRDPETMGTPDEDITTEIDVSAFLDIKLKSMACHRTQMQPDGPFSRLSPEMTARIMGTEHFIQAFPPFQGERPQRGLFP